MKLTGFLLLLLLMNCPGDDSNHTSKHVPARQAPQSQEFKMRVGEDVVFKGEGLKVRFVSVIEDSRCPKGEQCITEGNGKIELQLKNPLKEPVTLVLNTAVGTQVADYEEFEVKLVALDPYPKMGRSIKPADYVATVLVSKNGPSSVSSMALL
jgi:phage shock protein E